jgi:hypothetical protein
MAKQLKTRYTLLASAILLSACSTPPVKPPEKIAETYSTTYPVRTLTGFTEGLVCMDKMFVARKVEPIYITAAPIPDASENRGASGYAARDMLITAIAEMGKESAALRYVAFDRQTPDIVALQSSHPKKASLRIPDFFIRGAVTQINNAPYSKQRGGSANVGKLDKNFQGGSYSDSSSLALSSVSLDLAMGLVNNYQILPGMFSANTFSVEKRGSADDYSISMPKLGLTYSTSENSAEAMSRALRALVEVGAIELFGKLYNLPYWECLAIVGEATPERNKAGKLYSTMSSVQRANYVLAHLKNLKMVALDAQAFSKDGYESTQLRNALMQYRVRHNVFGSAGVDFAIFEQVWKDIELSRTVAMSTLPNPTIPPGSDQQQSTSDELKIVTPKGSPAPEEMKVPQTPGAPLLPPPLPPPPR